MEVGEKDLPLAHQRPFLGQGLLHLDHQLGPLPDLGGALHQLRPGLGVEIIIDAAAGAGTALHQHRVAGPLQFLGAHRQQGNAVLVSLHLSRNAHDHDVSPVTAAAGGAIPTLRGREGKFPGPVFPALTK